MSESRGWIKRRQWQPLDDFVACKLEAADLLVCSVRILGPLRCGPFRRIEILRTAKLGSNTNNRRYRRYLSELRVSILTLWS